MKINRQRLWVMAWFTFTRRERNGILMLSCLLLCIQSVLLYRYFIAPDIRPAPVSEMHKAFISSGDRPVSENQPVARGLQRKKLPLNTEMMDPNRMTLEEWKFQGLSEKQAAVVVKWVSRGGVFRSRSDVAGMKFIPPEVYRNLEPWLVFSPGIPERKVKLEGVKTIRPKEPIDLNTADTILLGTLPLIGEGRARSIWRYRERLGGFFEPEQLKEVRFIPDSVYRLILPRVVVRTPVYRKIDVNTVTDTLYHPYFSRKLLKMIVAWRSENGLYLETTQLRQLPLVDEDLWRKIAPYISISPK